MMLNCKKSVMRNILLAITNIGRCINNHIIRGIKILIIFLLPLLLLNCSFSTKYEKQMNEILDWEKSNGVFSDEQFDKVFEIIEKNPQTFEYDFSIPDDSFIESFFQPHKSKVSYMNFVESNDQQVRAYILERHGFSGNPSLGFETSALIQYKIGGEIFTYRLTDTYSIIEEIANLSDNKYLLITYYGNIAQGDHNYNQARVYKLDENGIHLLTNVFEKDGKLVNEIEVYWESGVYIKDEVAYNATSQNPNEEDSDEYKNWGIQYNWLDKNLYVANTRDVGNYKLLDGTFRYYRWNGKIFNDETIMSPYEIKNEDFYIRIEQNRDGSCIYKCWNGGVKSGTPSLTIRNGRRELWDEVDIHDYNKWISLDAYVPLGEKYTFTNNGFTYQYYTGWSKGRQYEELNVLDSKDNLIYSKEFKTVKK